MAYDYDDNPTYCSTCGTAVEPDARFCPNCGAATDPQGSSGLAYAPRMPYEGGPGYVGAANVPNYLVQAILVTIFTLVCCGIIGCIPGVIAIVFAAQVNGRLNAGDYNGALRFSNNAKTLCWVSLGLGIFGVVVYIFVFFIFGLAGNNCRDVIAYDHRG